MSDEGRRTKDERRKTKDTLSSCRLSPAACRLPPVTLSPPHLVSPSPCHPLSRYSSLITRHSPCRLRAVAYAELAVDVFEVCFDGVDRDDQLIGDLGVRAPGGEQVQHALLLGRKRLGQRRYA